MKVFKFEHLFSESGWINNVFVLLDDLGNISSISTKPPIENIDYEAISGWSIPGFINAHSHAFQYAMSGSAEHIPANTVGDDFWSWRNAMYKLALSLNSKQLENIASQLYQEMIAHGYTSVVEFHYLHHSQDGTTYPRLAEMANALIQAAKNSGIAITLVPILYQQYDLETQSTPQQRRFISKSLDDYWRLFEASSEICKSYYRAKIGLGFHSLRAVPPDVIIECCNNLAFKVPIHMHIAEQQREVEQCISVLGKPPIQWLVDNVDIDERFNLVHATHINKNELIRITKQEANVVLCPSTEGNLGDGFFPLIDYLKNNGQFAIGTDSHIGLSPFEELRWLDYGQRLLHQKRNIACLETPGNSAEILFKKAHSGGQLATGNWQSKTLFSKGSPFDCVVLNNRHPRLNHNDPNRVLSSIIYSGDKTIINGVITSGQWVKKHC